jgi:hypothetical protein
MVPDLGMQVLRLRAALEHRKNFHGKDVIGRFAGLSNNPIGMMVYVPELSGITISTNVVCDQVIPKPDEEYRQALQGVLAEQAPPMSLTQVDRIYSVHYVG